MLERRTQQRAAIQAAFDKAGVPLSPSEVLALANDQKAGLGLATVYRTINTLLEQGWLVKVDMPGGITRYERAGKAHHHHFSCTRCNKVFEIHGCPGNLAALLPKGFELTDHEVILQGLCDLCAASTRAVRS